MPGSKELFPAYAELLALTNSYGGVEQFEARLRQAEDMSANGQELETKGVRFSARGRHVYGAAHGVQDFVGAARKAFDAANQGEMRNAEKAAQIAKQYQKTFFNLFNHGIDPRRNR